MQIGRYYASEFGSTTQWIYSNSVDIYNSEDVNISHNLSTGDKIKILDEFRHSLFNKCKIDITKPIQLFIDGIKDNSNYDDSNKINALDLLVDIIQIGHSKKLLNFDEYNEGLLPLLVEQLFDFVNLGRCPQGRSTRLLQIYSLMI